MARDVLLITHEGMLAHDPGREHPERPARLAALTAHLRLHESIEIAWEDAAPVARRALERVHSPAYLDFIDSKRGRSARIDADTVLSPATVEAAALAAGAAVRSVDAALEPGPRAAVPFALVRPPGHHAETSRAMGFCFYNNIAVAAAHAIAHHGLSRIMIVDFDVHHGNGTEEIFYERDDALYLSVHQSPCYPGTGALGDRGRGAGEGFNINIPLPPGCGDAAYDAAFAQIVEPAAARYRPELLLVSAGFDAHRRDPLAAMNLAEAGFARITKRLMNIANENCDGRIAFALEGGYHLPALCTSVSASIAVINGHDALALEDTLHAAHAQLIHSIRDRVLS